MQRLIPMIDNSGVRYLIPEDRVDEFRADMGEVAEARRYRDKDGQHYTIPQDQDEAFRADMPDAVPVRSYTMADGTRRDFTMSEMSKFLRSKEYRESEDNPQNLDRIPETEYYWYNHDVDPNNIKGTGISINPADYDTKLTPEQERGFQAWRAKLDRGLQYDGDYDLRGAYLDNVQSAISDSDGKPHMSDKFKKPNHKTFSVHSKYAKDFPELAGDWDGNNYILPKAEIDLRNMGSPTWAGVKGALAGAAEGAYYGGKNAVAKVVTAIPEAAASVGEAVGNAVNLGGNAKNPVGDWLRESGRQIKRWLEENIRGDKYDEDGNLVMSGLTKDLGYEDTLTKIGETAGDAAAMAVKFAPAAVAGPAYTETILASDGINAFADTFDRAKAAGYSDAQANLAGTAAGLINYYGAKLMMKGGAATKDIANPLLRALASTAFTGAATGAQAVGNKGVKNVIEGKPITEGMLGAAGEGFVEGAQFHLINEVGTNARPAMNIRRETREMREMRKQNLLTAIETPEGRAFVDGIVKNDGVDAAIRARKEGKDVSRRMGAAADLPDNMSAAERNAVIDGIAKAREAQAERVRTKMDDVQAQSLADAIGGTVGDMNDPNFEKVWIKAVGQIKDATELDDPAKRAEIVWNAVKEVFGAEADGNDGVKREAVFDEQSLREKNIRNRNNRIERRIAEQNLGERKIIKEMQEEADTLPPDQPVLSGGEDLMRQQANIYATEDVAGAKSYSTWLKKRGQKDTESNRVKWFESYASRKPDAKSVEGTKVRAERKAEMEDYERADAERKAREAREESTLQPQETRIEVGKTAERIAEPEEAGKAQWPEYKAWLKNKGRDDTAKSWNRFVMENELDPNLRVDTKDQQSYSAFRERMEGLVEPQKPRRFPKDQEAAAQAEEQRGAEMRMNRNSDFRKLKDAGLSDEDAGYYLTYGKEAFYKRRVEQWEASRVKAQKQGQKFEEPKPERESLDYDALLAEQKSRMEAADKAAADAAHEERGKGLAEAFADWREESVKAQKQGKKSPEPTAEVEDVRAKAEADSVVQRLNAEWQKAKTPAERNAIKVQLIDRLKQLGIGAIERGTSAAEKPAEPAKPQPADNAPSHAPQETKPTSRTEGAEGKEARNSASVVTVGSMTERMTAKGRIVDSVVKVNDDGSVIIREQTFRKGNDKPYRETDRTYSADEAAQIIGNKTPTTTKTIRVPDGKGKMVEKPKGGNDYDSLVESYKSNEERLTEAVNSGNEVARLEALIEQAKTELKLRKAEVGMTKTFDRTANMSLTNNALKNRISDLMEALASERGRMVEKPAPSPEAATKILTPTAKPAPEASAPVVDKSKGGEVAVEAPDSVEAKIGAMPYGQDRRKAQFDYMDAEVKKAKGAIKGKFTKGKDKKWTTEDKSVSPTITVKVPADGEFTVANNPDGIALLEKMSAKLKAQVKDSEKELPTGHKNARSPFIDKDGKRRIIDTPETVWTKDKPSATPKSPSLAVKKPAKNVTVEDAAEIVEPFVDKVRKSLTKPHVGDGVVVATDGRRLVIVDVPGAKESGEKYPNWEQVIPKKTAHEAKFSTEELYTKLEQAKVVADGENNVVEIYELPDGSLGVRAKGEIDFDTRAPSAEYSTHEKMPKDARLVGTFNVDFLLDATKTAAKMGDKEMRIGYNDSHSPVVHRGNGYKQVIMPLRLGSVEPADRLTALRSDAKVKSWAQKNGYSVVDGEVSPRAVTEYLRSQTKKAVAATKRLFKDAEVEVKDRDWDAEIDGENGALRDKEGRVVGTFDPATKKVTLYRGADERTVYHELIGHGVEDWARRNNTALHGKLTELARTAPRELVEDVRSRYPDADEATLTKEIIARIAEGKGLENIKLKDAPKTWYAKAYVAVKDALVGFMEKIGLNRIDLSKTDDMTPSEAMDYLMREIGKGKTLGEIGTADAQGKMSRAEKWANKYYDRHTSLGKVSKEAADAKALQPGREAEFEIMKFNPKKEEFKKLLKDGNVTGNEVDEYMRAVAAKERNAADGRESSGMSDERINATLRFYENHPRINAIKRAADFMWRLQDEGMRERIRSGLVSEAEYAEWKTREEHHVPFRSAIDENGDHIAWNDPRGVAGHEFVQHEGRYSESGSPTAWMFEEYANAHLRAIENDTRKVLADAVSRDASLGSIETNPNLRESRLNGDGGDRNVVSYKDVGENGRAVVKHIVLKGERGAAAASSYTNRDLMNKSPLLKKTQAFMRFWSSTATEWSPTFALRNTFADNVDLAAVVLAEKGAKEGSAWIKDYAKNRVAVAKEVWRFAHKGKVDANSTLGRYVREGGMIGGFQREGYGDLVKQFSAEDIAKDFSNGGNRAKAVAKKVFGLVGAVNTYAELMTRVSAFKTNLDNGMSAKDAALWSRRISVDFSRKGNVTPVTNTLYMFSNSTIGATIRQLEAVKTAWKTPQGKRALLGLAAFGVAEALLEHAMNADSDEEREKKGEATGKDVNEFTRKTSLYVRAGGRVFRAPTHEDPLMKIVYAANAATRVALGTMSKEDFAKEVGLGIVEDVPRFFGQGSKNVDAGFNTWVPTALQPLVQGIENKDYAGRPIYRPKYNESLPDSSNGRKSTQAQYKWAAETVNELTGGNKGRKGSVDIAPETVKLISESLGKNVGKDIGNAIDVGWNLLTGNFGELDSRRAPFVRDVVRKTEGNDNRYFEAVRRFNADKLDLQTRDKARNWKDGERRAYYEAHPHLRKNGGTSTRVERLINGHTDGDTHIPGINDLRRMEGGERRVKTAAGWKWRAYDWPAEKVEEFKRKRLKKQAKVLAIMGD